MNIGDVVGKSLIFVGAILLFSSLYVANTDGVGAITYLYAGIGLGAIGLGAICYEVGKCSAALSAIRYEVKTHSVLFQNIIDLKKSILKTLAEK